MRFFRFLIAIVLFSLPTSRLWAEVPNVTTDIPAVHSLVSQVMGELGQPSLLVSGLADLHHFQLRPSQIRNLGDADLVFWIGDDLTPWLARALETVGDTDRSVALIDQPDTFQIVTNNGDSDHSGRDLHIWLDPENALIWFGVIALRLSELDPENREIYQHNADAAKHSLRKTITNSTAILSETGPHQIITTHDAFGHFANRFGIKIAGSVSDGEASAPSAARIKHLRTILEADQIQCAFLEPLQPSAILEPLIEGFDIRIGVLDPSGTSLTPGADLYSDLINSLVRAIADCSSHQT